MGKVFIIAEAGVNHNGDLSIAKKLVEVAADVGADAIKFQTFKAKNIVCKDAEKANYQLYADNTETQYEMLEKLELTYEMHQELIKYCHKYGILFLSTPFDSWSIDLLNRLDIKIFKIPSGEITNYPYLKKVGQLKKKVILSTGMSNICEIHAALNVLYKEGTTDITLLHCNTEYPTPMRDVNLKAISRMKEEFGIPVGYSDHTKGIEASIAAVAIGASIIEKHFTLSRSLVGPDHNSSLEPTELSELVKSIRNIELALQGNGEKHVTPSERDNIKIVRKSIVASKPIKAGEILTEENLITKRPGLGINPMLWNNVIGTKAIKNFDVDEMIII